MKGTIPSASAPGHPNLIPSSSPAFGTPVHPTRPQKPPVQSTNPTILPILLPPATLRPLAFRTFTKKHSLTLTSAALQALATFIGRHCGSGWREEGLAEKVLEETAKAWKRDGGGVIVAADGNLFKDILKGLEGSMIGGRLVHQNTVSRQGSLVSRAETGTEQPDGFNERPGGPGREDSQASLSLSALDVNDNENDDDQERDPRHWMKIVGAFEQPRLVYNASQKHFEKAATAPSLLPDPLHKTTLFRHRYNLIHQRLLRNESFQIPTITHSRVPTPQPSSSTITTTQQAYKLTPIANLLGRSGSNHLLLGILTISPTGMSALSDLTGSITLELRHARPVPEDGAWFTPGMIVLVDGVYEEEESIAGTVLGGGGGVGGTIGGKFVALSVGGPPCERREVTLGVGGPTKSEEIAGGGFGWVDFLGVGSERATGSRMRRLEKVILRQKPTERTAVSRGRIAILGEVNLDNAKTIQALKKILATYATNSIEELPFTFMLIGNFVKHAVMAGGGSGGSIEYKEYFDSLASVLSEHPRILQATTFVFVPGDNDPWASAFSAGAATALPRKRIPELFTSRVKRAFATANAEPEAAAGAKMNGEAIWTTNPARVSLFGPVQEIVIFRDDLSGRLRRSALSFHSTTGPALDEVPERTNSHQGTPSEERYEGGLMDVDDAVKDAESHIPAPKGREPVASPSPSDLHTARKLVKTILDQGYLSPFPLSHRPVLWDFAGSLQLYPLPTALVLVDPDAPHFTVTYEGCHVMNPGRLVADGRKGSARWIEYDAASRRGKVREVTF